MKKFVKIMMLAMAMLCSTNVMAQRQGLSAAGVNFGWQVGSYSVNNFGIGLKYGYMVSDNLRLEASGMYYLEGALAKENDLRNKDYFDKDGDFRCGYSTSWIDVNVNAHYLFEVADKISVFPVFGFSTMFRFQKFNPQELSEGKAYDYEKFNEQGNYRDNYPRIGLNFGIGGQYDITDDFAITAEAKYKLIKDFGNFNLAVGCVVLF